MENKQGPTMRTRSQRRSASRSGSAPKELSSPKKSNKKKQKKKDKKSADKKEEVKGGDRPQANQAALDAADQAHSEKEPEVPAEEDQQAPLDIVDQAPSKESEVPAQEAHYAPSKEPEVRAHGHHQAHSENLEMPAHEHHQVPNDKADQAHPDDARGAPDDVQVLPNARKVPVQNQQESKYSLKYAVPPGQSLESFLTGFLQESIQEKGVQNMNQSRYNSDEKMHGSPDIYNQFNLQHRDDQMDDDIDLQVRDSKKVSVDQFMNSEDEESKEPGSEEVKGINPRKRKYDEVSGVDQAPKQDDKHSRGLKEKQRIGDKKDLEMIDLSESQSKDEDDSFDSHKIPKFSEQEMEQLSQIKFSNMENGLFSEVKTWFFTDDSVFSTYSSVFNVEKVHKNENFLIANPVYLSTQINMGKFYKPYYVINGMNDTKKAESMLQLFSHFEQKGDVHDMLVLLTKMLEQKLQDAFYWQLCSMLRITYPMIKQSLVPALLEEYNIQRPPKDKNKQNTTINTLRDGYSMIKRVKPKLSDFSNEKWALFPGNNLKRAPISFLDYLRDDEESISLKLFATQHFSVEKQLDILQVIAQFLKVLLEPDDEQLKTIASIINKHHLMYIKLFRFLYQNIDLSPFKQNKILQASNQSSYKTYVIYARLFQGLAQYFNTITISNLKSLRNQNPKAVFNLTDKGKDTVWGQNRLSQSQIILSLLKEAQKQDGESIWGRGQLPLEAKESKIIMFDVRAISLYHTEEINTLSNYSVKHAAPKARTTVIADVPKDEQVEIPVKSLQKKIEIQDKLKWFKTLLGHDNELDVFKKTANQYLLQNVVQAPEDQLQLLYIDLSLAVLLNERGDGTFFGCMAKILKTVDQENESHKIQSLEQELEQRFGPLAQLYIDSNLIFEYIPQVFNKAIIQWISHSKSPNLKEQITHFIKKAIPDYSKRITFPFSWIKKLDGVEDVESIQSIIQSNQINPMLDKICKMNCDKIIQEDLIYAMSLLNDNIRFAQWLPDINQMTVNNLKQLIKKNSQCFILFANFIDNAIKKENEQFCRDSALIIEILENYIDNKISLDQFNDTCSQQWYNHQIKILNGTLIDSFYQRIKQQIETKLPLIFDKILDLKSKKFSDSDFQKCIPKCTKILATDSQALIAAQNAYIIINHGGKFFNKQIYIEQYKWILNGISAGCGKSVLITFIANHLAQEGKNVYVLACNKYLTTQLEHKFIHKSTDKGKIIITSPNSENFMDIILGESLEDIDTIKKSIVIVDEIDYFEEEERIIINRGYSKQLNASRIYCFDILRALGEFQNVITFSNEIPSTLKKSIKESFKYDLIIDFDFGTLRGSGKDSYIQPEWIKRRNQLENSYVDDTFDQIKKIIESDAPKCLYIIMNQKHQVSQLQDLLEGNIGERQIFMLDDIDNSDQSSKIIQISREVIKYESGFVFITHSLANRGVDIQGVEPATVIANYRFSTGSDLDQALSRGNRSFNSKYQSKTYVFCDEIPKNCSTSLIQGPITQNRLRENVYVDKLCKIFHGIQIDCRATDAEKENLINLINSFRHGLNAIVGNGDQLAFKTLLQIYINLNLKTEDLFKVDIENRKFIVQIDKEDSQDVQDLKMFAKSISPEKFKMFYGLIVQAHGYIGTSNVIMIFLLRGICCAFPIFSQSASSYMTQKALSILCEALRQATALRRHSTFSATSGDVPVAQFIEDVENVLHLNRKYY